MLWFNLLQYMQYLELRPRGLDELAFLLLKEKELDKPF